MMKKSLTIFLVCALAVLFSSCSFRLGDLTYVQNTLKGLTSESSETNAIGVLYDVTIYEKSIRRFVEKQDSTIDVKEVITCKGDRVYFSASQNGYCGVYSVRNDGTNLTMHLKRRIDRKWVLPWLAITDSSTGKIDFSEAGAFCHKGKIIMFDQEYVSELDIFTGKVAEYPTEQYAFPEIDCPIYISDGELYKASGELIPTTWIAEKSDAFRQILELKDFKIWDDDSPLKHLYCRVQQVDQETYLICEVLDWHGHAYAVVFSYDPLTENVAYLWHQYTGDIVETHYHLIPVYE